MVCGDSYTLVLSLLARRVGREMRRRDATSGSGKRVREEMVAIFDTRWAGMVYALARTMGPVDPAAAVYAWTDVERHASTPAFGATAVSHALSMEIATSVAPQLFCSQAPTSARASSSLVSDTIWSKLMWRPYEGDDGDETARKAASSSVASRGSRATSSLTGWAAFSGVGCCCHRQCGPLVVPARAEPAQRRRRR